MFIWVLSSFSPVYSRFVRFRDTSELLYIQRHEKTVFQAIYHKFYLSENQFPDIVRGLFWKYLNNALCYVVAILAEDNL